MIVRELGGVLAAKTRFGPENDRPPVHDLFTALPFRLDTQNGMALDEDEDVDTEKFGLEPEDEQTPRMATVQPKVDHGWLDDDTIEDF